MIPTPLPQEDLAALLHAVQETTERLHDTHETLRGEVARLEGELAQANARLRRTEALAALGEMAAGIAHEIRNPLASLQLFVRILAEDVADRPEAVETCAKIERAVVSMDRIVVDVLAFAREGKLHPEATTAGALIDSALESCRAEIEAAEIVVDCDAVDRSLVLRADPGSAGRALVNVIRNAAEAMKVAGTQPAVLRLAARRERRRGAGGSSASYGVIAVQDSGPGIPPEVRERMFNPFFTTRSAGTGLGLPIVHRIVDAHGGHVHVEDVVTESGGGARIELCLPDACPPVPTVVSAGEVHA